jgi:hypothetical protein
MAIVFLNLKNPFAGFASPFFCRQVAKMRPKKPHKTHWSWAIFGLFLGQKYYTIGFIHLAG